MTTNIVKSLGSALSSLQAQFPNDSEKLHFAVATVFSSIFLAHSFRVIIVGGQAATHWLRVSGSRDVDLVSDDFEGVRDTLELVGFQKADDMPFRMIHPGISPTTSVLIELVGEDIEVAGLRPSAQAITTIRPANIENPVIRDLMEGDGLVMNPCLVFLNYADASSPDSTWHDLDDDGGLAHDRAKILLDLYRSHIIEGLRELHKQQILNRRLLDLLSSQFGVVLK